MLPATQLTAAADAGADAAAVVDHIVAKQGWVMVINPDVTGVTTLHAFEVAQDGRSYAYGYTRLLSTLFVMDGLTQ